MNSVLAHLSGVIIAVLFLSTPAEAGRLLNKARKNHSHGHGGHDHGGHSGHNHGSGWRFEVGAASRVSLASEKPEEEAEHHEEEEHEHELALSDGHDHSHGGGDSGGGSSASSAMPTFSLGAAYGFNSSFAVTSEVEFASSEGLEDPKFGLEHRAEVNKALSWKSNAGASVPLAKESQESGLMTALSFGTGPSWQFKRWKVGFTGSYTHYLYKARPADETAAVRKVSFSLDEHEGEEHGEEHSEEHGDEHGEEHDHEEEELEPRNSNQIRGATTVGYRLTKRIGLGSDFSVARMAMDNGTSSYTTETTLAKASYSLSGFTGEAGVGLKATAPAIAAPNLPFIGLSVSYEYE